MQMMYFLVSQHVSGISGEWYKTDSACGVQHCLVRVITPAMLVVIRYQRQKLVTALN
jgi:hypothetical protein